MVTDDGVVKIVDFGLAKLAGRTKITKSGTTMGTVAYMSPEQAQGADTDHRTDIWSLGVVLYEMLTGQLPFSGEYEMALMYSLINTDPKTVRSLRSEVSGRLEAIVNKALAKEADERYQNIEALLDDLRSLDEKQGTGALKKHASKTKYQIKPRSFLVRSLAAVVILLVALGIYLWRTPQVEATQVSIAVLPLKNIAEVSDQDWFAEGMTDALITDLAKIGGMRVISRSSSMQYKSAPKPIPEIARELHVDYVIDGSVLKVGNQIRISAQLINAPKDEHLWAESYTKDFANVLVLQSEIAHAIASQVRVKLTPQEQKRLTSTRPVNPEAHEAYLKGLFDLHQLALNKSIEFFQQAISKDPNYALPYAALSEAYSLSGIFLPRIKPEEVIAQAREAALKALRIDSTLSDAYTALGEISLFFDFDWKAVEVQLQKAIQLNPSNAAAHRWYALYSSAVAHHEEAIAASKRAYQLDPLAPLTGEFVGLTYYFARQYDQAIKEYQNLLELHPNFGHGHYLLGFAYKEKKRYKEAIAALKKSIELAGGDDASLAGLANVFAVSGNKSEAMKILAELETKAKREHVSSQEIAGIYIGLGDKDKAFALLEKAYAEKTAGSIMLLKVAPWLDPLRSDPRFTALMKKVNLAP